MDLLYTAAIAWSQLLTFRYDIICGKSKKLYPISLDFKEDEFYHLAGFPHIKDIVFPTQFPQSAMLRKVLDGTITEQMISKSEGYEKTVKSKLLAIIQLEKLLSNCSKVYMFDPKRLGFYTQIKAKYLLVDEQSQVVFLFADTKDAGKTYFSRSTFIMDNQEFRRNQSSMTVLQIKRTLLHIRTTEILFCRDGFSEETAANNDTGRTVSSII